MAAANAEYYATRDPLGRAGDFITAPEISQMFGELVGAWAADLWLRAGRPPAHYVELGPGRGTLAADALRAMRPAGLAPPVHFVEASPVLRVAQAGRVPGATWHDDIAALPSDAALLIVANEFFDALPIHQYWRTDAGWRERMIAWSGTGFVPVPGHEPADAAVPPALRDAPPGSLVETCPTADGMTSALAQRLTAQGGALLVIDYGHRRSAVGETLQAVSGHAFAEPFVDPGSRDLTAHVDFAAMASAAAASGATLHGPVDQGAWLDALGIGARAAALARAAPDRAAEIAAARDRLVGTAAMGRLFKILAITAPGWPRPAGF